MAESKCYRIVTEIRGKKKVFYVWADCPMNATFTLQNNRAIGIYNEPKSKTLKKEYNNLFPERTFMSEAEFIKKLKSKE